MKQYRKENFTPDSKDLQKYFAKGTLIPAVVQEVGTGEVLMLAYMNEESLRKTMETGYTWFYSRSRQELWNKGATSGHVQKVLELRADCDNDTLLVLVEQTGRCLPYWQSQLFLHNYLGGSINAGHIRRIIRRSAAAESRTAGRLLYLLSV